MTTKKSGDQAETIVCEYLSTQGFKILERNWRTRWCEIDIVAQKAKTVYFVEVKFRYSQDFGGGFEYITPTKLKQMHFAAEMWLKDHKYNGQCALSAAAVDSDFKVDFIDNIS